MNELPLVFFTTLSQLGAGMFVVLATIRLTSVRPQVRLAAARGQFASLVIVGLGGLAAVFHLGRPLRAMNVLFGLAHTSALSIEIVLSGIFTGAVAVYLGCLWFGLFSSLLKDLLQVAAMVLGVIFMAAIGHVYTLSTVPTWGTVLVYFQFFGTALLLGTAAAAVAMTLFLPAELKAGWGRGLAGLGVVAAPLVLAVFAWYVAFLGGLHLNQSPIAALHAVDGFVLLRVLLVVTGAVLLLVGCARPSRLPPLVLAGTVSLLLAELAGRIVFYSLHISAGL